MDQINVLTQIKDKVLKEVQETSDLAGLESLATQHLGKNSQLNSILRGLKDMPEEERGKVGAAANVLRTELTNLIEKKVTKIKTEDYKEKLSKETFDPTIPGLATPTWGKLHPLTQERIIVEDIFERMGFEIIEPNLIDDDYHNFTSINIPEGHPARDMWDTIWTESDNVLITHTSSMQNRIMKSHKPPIRAIVPGKCFRNEATDATHEHSFLQVEGVYVDRGIKLSDLIGTLHQFLKEYFGQDLKIKLQPTYFPFVEPALEMMIEASVIKRDKGQGTGDNEEKWLEVIPCGPIHPYVLKEAGLDPNAYTGFAWGAGLDRLVMLKYGIEDIRLFHSGKLDFLNQF